MHNTVRGKCVVLGSATTGKSALVQMFVSDGREFPRNYCMSVSAELVLKNILIPDANDTVEMFIYTLPGKSVFNELIDKYVDQINMLIVVFDVTEKASFSYAQSILSKYHEAVLIGNKTDLEARRIITSADGERLAKSFSIPFYETSAKEAVGIETPFLYLAKEYHNLYLKKIENFQTMI
ncbi:hypothetical protein EG68_09161 [Paragonimus skrjabini miyazakii]|uniref:Intraflagellar transport protein 27 n=1 Tax=Paragonimus skrjabini miyazakii TaxID=59628 RepID=A0A8S9YI71_9TREM|nr:hypothetical protein EG68_09161 [Paragonimus skrjabini miyazakii]